MKRFLAVPFLVFLCAPAAEAACVSYPDVPVNITPVFESPKYDFSENLAAIQQIASDRQHVIPHNESVTLGITRYERVLQFHIPMEIEQRPGDLACAWVKEADITVGYRAVTVFIAREIPGRSCGYEETVNHEQKHVEVNRELLIEYIPRIKEAMKNYLRANGMFRVQDPKYAEQLLREKLNIAMQAIIKDMEAENVRRQQQVDSPEEYARLAHVCQGQLTVIADNYRRGKR